MLARLNAKDRPTLSGQNNKKRANAGHGSETNTPRTATTPRTGPLPHPKIFQRHVAIHARKRVTTGRFWQMAHPEKHERTPRSTNTRAQYATPGGTKHDATSRADSINPERGTQIKQQQTRGGSLLRRAAKRRQTTTPAKPGGTPAETTQTMQRCAARAPRGEGSISKTTQPPRLNKKRCVAQSKQARTQASNSHKLATTTKNRARACQNNTRRCRQTKQKMRLTAGLTYTKL